MRSGLAVCLALASFLALVSCGSSDSGSLFPDGGGEADGSVFDGGNPGFFGDASFSLPPDDGSIGSACTPRSCAQAGANCGPVSDGCGGIVDCGACNAPDTCGGGGFANVCGGHSACVPKSCADQGATCGPAGDGCGGVLDCGSCTAPATCGGGGIPSACGGNSGCVPKTACPAGQNCGAIGDGCGGVVPCGPAGSAACAGNDTCGGGGVANQCGTGGPRAGDGGPGGDGGGNPQDAGPACVPRTCPQIDATCGDQGDGCGNIVHCGACAAPTTCGGGGTANHCGGNNTCVPKTSCPAGSTCGAIADGCGGLVQCGTANGCAGGQTCGGGGVANQCGGAATCVPKTCAQLGANCGAVGDGCGGILPSCGTCTAPAICGGGGVPSNCSSGAADGGPVCQGLQCQQVNCDAGATVVTGTVFDPAGLNPVYNAYVYVPNYPAQVKPFAGGVSCDQCGSEVTGTPLVSAVTGADGKFTLTNVPVGNNITLVIQIGRWRRIVTINVAPCATTVVPAAQTHLPTTHTEGDIPLMAIATGEADPFECLLVKMGIKTSEFVNPTAAGTPGRIHYYSNAHEASHANGVDLAPAQGGPAPAASTLWSSATKLAQYDIVLLPCEGAANLHNDDTPANVGNTGRSNLLNYANVGGRIFATHYSYAWLAPPTPTPPVWNSVGTWDEDQAFLSDKQFDWCTANGTKGPTTSIDSTINTSFPKGKAFADWMQLTNSTPDGYGILSENEARHDIDAVNAVATPWVTLGNLSTARLRGYTAQGGGVCLQQASSKQTNSANAVQHLTFNTPTNATLNDAGVPGYCGRVVFTDFHVSAAAQTGAATFPAECKTGPLSAQEKALEFTLFDLGNCIQPDNLPPVAPPTCTPRTCAQAGATCGPVADGCGNILQCGTCVAPLTCGGGGVANQCGGCIPNTCPAQGITCGPAGDGCGNVIQCGTCVAPQTCGGGGTPGLCGAPPACTPRSCPAQGLACGPAGDGCGNVIQCGTCVAPQTCGGGGTPGVCGSRDAGSGPSCVPLTCPGQGVQCGPAGDGCGNLLQCGNCVAPLTCGGGGTPGVCGGANCTPRTCPSAGANCGAVADGCGGLLQCGTCTGSQTCGGAGTSNVCGVPVCTPRTCADQGANCGPVGDGCGNVVQCGDCALPSTCGGGGVASQCGGGIR